MSVDNVSPEADFPTQTNERLEYLLNKRIPIYFIPTNYAWTCIRMVKKGPDERNFALIKEIKSISLDNNTYTVIGEYQLKLSFKNSDELNYGYAILKVEPDKGSTFYVLHPKDEITKWCPTNNLKGGRGKSVLAAYKPKGPQPSDERVVIKGKKRVVYVGPKGGKYLKQKGVFVRL